MATGTNSLADLLAAKNLTVVDYGLDKIDQIIQVEINAHNNVTNMMLDELSTATTERAGVSGASSEGQFVEVDEFGRSPTQKPTTFGTVAFPLRAYQSSLGWTDKYFKSATPSDLAIMFQRRLRADLLNLQYEIKRSMFPATNYTFVDKLIDGSPLAVKRFLNADSDSISAGPNGEQFDGSTHQHYLGSATLTTAAVDAMIQTVVEHGHSAGVRIYIARADVAAWSALAGFVKALPVTIVGANNANQVNQPIGGILDIGRVDNRLEGYYNGIPVYTKPWMIAFYAYCFAAMDQRKPLRRRQRASTALQGLQLAAKLSTHPMYADMIEREIGFAVGTRTNGSVLQFNSASYTSPTISKPS
jgi:hypothetical protein